MPSLPIEHSWLCLAVLGIWSAKFSFRYFYTALIQNQTTLWQLFQLAKNVRNFRFTKIPLYYEDTSAVELDKAKTTWKCGAHIIQTFQLYSEKKHSVQFSVPGTLQIHWYRLRSHQSSEPLLYWATFLSMLFPVLFLSSSVCLHVELYWLIPARR